MSLLVIGTKTASGVYDKEWEQRQADDSDSPTPVGGLGGKVVTPKPGGAPLSVKTGKPIAPPVNTGLATTIPAYQMIDGKFYYNPDNTAGIANFNNLPVNPSKSGGAITIAPTIQQIERGKIALAELKPYEVKPGLYNINQYLIDKPSGQSLENLYAAGFSREEVRAAAQENVKSGQEASEEANQHIAIKLAKSMWEGMTPWDESKGEQATPEGIVTMAGEILVPGVYTIRHWDEMSPTDKALSIAMDVIELIPFITAAAKGAKAVSTAGRGARFMGAVKGIGKEIVSQVRAPIDMVIHPIESVKGTYRTARELVENIADWHKIPEAVITTSDGTVRLLVDETTSPAQAMAIRDQLMDLVAQGKRPVVEVGDQVIELSQSALMKEIGGGVVHTTPQGGAFLNGLEVLDKFDDTGKIMPLSEQGLFVANQPLPRFAGSSAFGKTGDMPAILIFGKETAEKAIPSGKIYQSAIGKVSEMELKFPVGTVLDAPKQQLFTRIGPLGQRVEIFLDNPLNAVQIARLKGLALIEDLKAPFSPSLTISGTSGITNLTDDSVDEIVDILRSSDNIDQARALKNTLNITRTQRMVPRSLESLTGKVRAADILAERAKLKESGRNTTSPSPFDDKNVYDPYAETPESSRTVRAEAPPMSRAAPRAAPTRSTPTRPTPTRTEPVMRADVVKGREPDRTPIRPEEPDRTPIRPEEPDRTPIRPEEPDRTPTRPEEPTREAPRIKAPNRTPPRQEEPQKDYEGEYKLPDTEEKLLERVVFPKGTVAWKQGIGWWVFKPPYNRPGDREFVLTKPQGATIAADAKSAIGTIQAIGGKAPINTKFDMGIMDVKITSAPRTPSRDSGRAAIKFARDADKSYGGQGTRSKRVGPYHYKDGKVSRKPID
jgi:hypothetical protein